VSPVYSKVKIMGITVLMQFDIDVNVMKFAGMIGVRCGTWQVFTIDCMLICGHMSWAWR
jgi:hypothetical protein